MKDQAGHVDVVKGQLAAKKSPTKGQAGHVNNAGERLDGQRAKPATKT